MSKARILCSNPRTIWFHSSLVKICGNRSQNQVLWCSPDGNLERDSQFPKRGVQPFFEFPQIGGGRSFQLGDKFRVRRAGFSSTLTQHFVPPFLRAISVLFCHAGVLSVNWKPAIAQGRI